LSTLEIKKFMRSILSKYPQTFLLSAFVKGLKSAFLSKDEWGYSTNPKTYKRYRQTAYYLRRKGIVTIQNTPSGKKFLELTKKGELELLLAKTWQNKITDWDGKWRIIFFDIPENANYKRDKFRKVLLTKGFVKLQASVYISPYPLNRAAILYLNTSGLIEFIRIGRLEELDNDSRLRKKFKLVKNI